MDNRFGLIINGKNALVICLRALLLTQPQGKYLETRQKHLRSY